MARTPGHEPNCTIEVEGEPVPAREAESVAAALLAAGRAVLGRSMKFHRPRGAFCLSGECGNCLMRIDGRPNQLACVTPCRDGLKVSQQNVFPTAEHDLLGIFDWLLPPGFEHHTLLTNSQLANQVAGAVARQLAGLGTLPDRAPLPLPAATEEEAEAIVLGGGPAGLAAAEALAEAGRRTILVEQAGRLGGRLRARLDAEPSLAWAERVRARVAQGGGEVAAHHGALGVWHDGGRPLVGAIAHGAPDASAARRPVAGQGPPPLLPRMRLLRAPRVVVCTGGHAQRPVFENNDLPGILAARGAAMALAEQGLLPGARIAVCGGEAEAVARRFAEAGAKVEVVPGPIARARGRSRVRGVVTEAKRRVECDALLWAEPPAPAYELARQAGAWVEWDEALGAFAVRADAEGRAGAALWVAGEITGRMSAAEAAERGRAAGKAAAREEPK